MKRKIIITSLAIALTMSGCSNNINKELQMQTNKEKVVELLKSIQTGDTKPASYINKEKYIQHNLTVEDGLDGFGKVLAQLPKGSAKVDVIRAFSDDNFVFTHTKYNFFGPKIGFDIFRFEDGLIVEHWDNLQEIADNPNPSGHTQIDGATKITDISNTNENKLLVKNFINDILLEKAPQKINDYIGLSYIQHNPHVADNLEGLLLALKQLADAGTPMKYTKNHMLLGQGNFVLAVSEGAFMGEHVAFYDLFRVEDSKLVEHWDTIEAIPAKDEWKNSNGKF